MGVEVQDIDYGWDRIQKEATKMRRMYTKVGYFAGEGGSDIANIAAVQEHGADIRVTPKMKGFFLFKFGVSLKKTVIRIPARPWNRMTFDKYKEKVHKLMVYEFNRILEGKQTAKSAMSKIGEWYVGKLKETMTRGNFAPNSGFTVRQKGSSKPLIDTGTLRNSTTHREFDK